MPGRGCLDLADSYSRYCGERIEAVMVAVQDLFAGVGPDLALKIEDPSDPAFIDYARDAMSWAGVPREMIDHVAEWCRCGCPRVCG